MNKRKTGTEKEQIAWEFLRRHGVHMLERNYRTGRGEIDLIGVRDHTLIFFEVKYRSSERFGYPEDAVDRKKQRTICLVSDQYRMERMRKGETGNFFVRYDVISILGNHITWIPNAFAYQGRGW